MVWSKIKFEFDSINTKETDWREKQSNLLKCEVWIKRKSFEFLLREISHAERRKINTKQNREALKLSANFKYICGCNSSNNYSCEQLRSKFEFVSHWTERKKKQHTRTITTLSEYYL